MTPREQKRFMDNLARWREHPAAMVRELFGVEPDPWQEEILEAFPHNPYIAMAACKGPGKTCVLAWLIWNFLLTRPMPKIAATSINGDNLKDNLWAELALWLSKSPLLQSLFEWTTTRVMSKQHPETWWASARTWPKSGDASSQANTLAGLHADYIMFLLDESGGIPDAVLVSAEAALSSCKEGHIVQAGNPTHLTGPLYRASKDRRDVLKADGTPGRWLFVEITGDPDDPKRSPRVSIEWAREQIKEYGRDNPWVLVNVFGKFPPSSINALIGEDEVRAAMARYYRPHQIGYVPKIMGIDVARQGDDSSVIAFRHGPQMFPLKRYRNVPDGVTGASIANRHWNEFDADACFVDATGGLGFTWIDQLNVLGKAAIPVQFSSKPSVSDRYVNKRAEMYFLFVEWIKAGGALPSEETEGGRELLKALINTTYTFKNDRMILEEKDAIKAKIGFSPDEADAGALTFAEPVSVKPRSARVTTNRSAVGASYNPFAALDGISGGGYNQQQDFNPYRSG